MKKSFILLMVTIGLTPFMRGGYFLHSVYIIGCIICVALALKCIEERQLRIPIQTEGFFLFLITFLYGISTFSAVDTGMAFLGFLKILVILIFYLLIQQYDIQEQYKLLDILMYAGMIMAVLSILLIPLMHSYLIQNNRLGGFIQYANTFALFMVITLLMTFERGSSKDYFFIPFLVASIYLTYSRSMYVIALGVMCVCLYLYRNKLKTIIPCVLVGILLGMGLSHFSIFHESFDRVKTTSFQVSEFQSRLIYYEDGVLMIKDNPFGLGYYGYFYLQRAYQSGVYFIKFIHNSLLQIALDIGILGVLSFSGLIISYLWKHRKGNKVYPLIMMVIIGHSMIDFDFQFLFIWLIIVLLISIKPIRFKEIGVQPVGIFSLMLTATVFLYFLIPTTAYYFDQYATATVFYPYYTEAHVKALSKVGQEGMKDAKNIAEHVENYNENHVEINRFLRDYYMKEEAYDSAAYYGKQVVSLNQLDVTDLEIYTRSLLLLLKSDIIKDEVIRKEVIEEIEGLDTYIVNLQEGLSDRAYRVKHKPQLIMTENLKMMQREALALKEKLLDKESGS